ncbi:MAG: hypothetical protein PHQ00_05450 [Phycisphaerae bacterium]|nr:hypothetical protein [Phycisphaerae bacterium]
MTKTKIFIPNRKTYIEKPASKKQMDYIKILARKNMQDVSDLVRQGLSMKEAGTVINALLAMPACPVGRS